MKKNDSWWDQDPKPKDASHTTCPKSNCLTERESLNIKIFREEKLIFFMLDKVSFQFLSFVIWMFRKKKIMSSYKAQQYILVYCLWYFNNFTQYYQFKLFKSLSWFAIINLRLKNCQIVAIFYTIIIMNLVLLLVFSLGIFFIHNLLPSLCFFGCF